MGAPSIFSPPKTKSDEANNVFKFRNVISHASHPVKPLSKLVGRCLSLLVRELAIVDPIFSIPSMLGVRDIFFAAKSAQKSWHPPMNMEMDIPLTASLSPKTKQPPSPPSPPPHGFGGLGVWSWV